MPLEEEEEEEEAVKLFCRHLSLSFLFYFPSFSPLSLSFQRRPKCLSYVLDTQTPN